MDNKYMSTMSEQELKIVSKQSGLLICKYNIKTKTLIRFYDSPKERYGISKIEKNVPDSLIENNRISPNTETAYLKFFEDMNKGIPNGNVDIEIKNAEGSYVWHHGIYSLIYNEDGSISHALITFFDNRKIREKEIATEKWYASLSSKLSTSVLYAHLNLSKNIIEDIKFKNSIANDINDFESLINYVQKDIKEEYLKEYKVFFDRKRLFGLFHSDVYEDYFDFSIKDQQGKESWLRANIGMIQYPFSDDVMAIIIFTNIDKQKRVLDNLSHKANHDILTGILNREGISKGIDDAILNHKKNDTVAMFIIDLDNFKQVNDKLGHQVGDLVLQSVADVLKGLKEEFSVVGRLSGDEFIAFYTGNIKDNFLDKKAIKLLNDMKLDIGKSSPIKISVSIGIAYCTNEPNFERLYRTADIALYTSKKAGKGIYHIINADTNEEQSYVGTASGSSLMSLNDLIETSQMGALIKTTTPYEALVQNIPGGVLYIEIDNKIHFTYCNDWMYKFTGYSKEESEEIHKLNPLFSVHPDDLPEIFQKVQGLKTGNNSERINYRLKHKDGYYKYISLGASVTERTKDKLILYGVTTDIDEIVKLKEKLNSYNQRVSSIINAVPGGVSIFEITDELKIIHYNNWLFDFLGKPKQELGELRSGGILDLVVEDDLPLVMNTIKNLKTGSDRINVTFRVKHDNGTHKKLMLSGAIIERTEDRLLMYSIYLGKD